MKNKLAFAVCVLALVFCVETIPVLGLGGPAPKTETAPTSVPLALQAYLIDDFESGSLKSPREWWTFDIKKAEAVSNSSYTGGENLNVGNYSLILSGPAKSWYAGGCGTYLAKERQDLSKYANFQMDIFGNGPGSGTVKIELADDDNSNWQTEQDASKSYAFIADDKYVYEVKVDWSGWKRVSIPMLDFVDDNPLVGDDVWNPHQTNGSGGLLQVQFICIAGSDSGNVNFNIDNVMLTMGEPK